MRLYAGTVAQFKEDTIHNYIADKLKNGFENYYGRRANDSEIMSWTNSLQFLRNIVEESVSPEGMVVLEYELPYSTERIDCILFGQGEDNQDNVVVIELKQWSNTKKCEIDYNVITYVGKRDQMVPHPSIQVRGYHYYLKDFIDFFHENNAPDLSSCVYCHNYTISQDDPLFDSRFKEILTKFPIFTKKDYQDLGNFLKFRLSKGKGMELFNRFSDSKIKPSKKLVDVTKNMIEGQKVFSLLDEQLTANNTIIDKAKKCSTTDKKSVIIVKGGPGTGKSVIALNALSELLSSGMAVYHATGSSAFTKTLRKIVGFRSAKLFKFFNSFPVHKENEIDVLICDEAHRIRKTSNSYYTKASHRSNIPQIDELIKAAKVSIFFIDEFQVVRPEEIGSVELIKASANKFNAQIYEFELKTQFRCNGSDGYLNWVDDLLQIQPTANRILTKNEKIDFKIFNSPKELYSVLVEKNSKKANSARLVAGYCWSWSDAKNDGTLVDDVIIDEFKMPWEAKEESTKLMKGIPKQSLWAYDENGINQIGTVYTIQGFEFEYVGIIFAKDLVYDLQKKQWIGNKNESKDPMVKKAQDEEFTKYIKNIYRVLMTRGMKGCYVYFMDKDTETYVRSRVNL